MPCLVCGKAARSTYCSAGCAGYSFLRFVVYYDKMNRSIVLPVRVYDEATPSVTVTNKFGDVSVIAGKWSNRKRTHVTFNCRGVGRTVNLAGFLITRGRYLSPEDIVRPARRK